ncbi:DNA integration/recombination/inversion protein (plasmid) [Roseomonas mucosa]|nr:DNA integration/recombination/inversion protein [Roseomonas mucosa]QDD97444.1 DNA integration/recombination/inversion protein [Roseomonas mucosa]UZO94798.1 DNA integration/recombination/inversion protein [Roseomonas mucosa]
MQGRSGGGRGLQVVQDFAETVSLGPDLAQVMRQTRHRSAEVALGYLRPADLWRNNVTRRVFAQAAKETD